MQLSIRWFFGDVKLEPEQVTRGYAGEPSVELKFKLNDGELKNYEQKYILDKCIIIRAYCNLDGLDKAQSPKFQLLNDGERPKEIKKDDVPRGDVIFVPSIRELNDELKITANSTINKLISKFVVQRIKTEGGKEDKYQAVNLAIKSLSEYISVGDGSAFGKLKTALKKNMLEYPDIEVDFKLEPPSIEDLIKNCFRPLVKTYHGELTLETQGMGFQRSFIFSLISAVSELEENSENFTLYFIEEPEIFLHPNHQRNFRGKLGGLANKPNNQVIITSHSTHFINNISNYSEIKRVLLRANYSDIKEITQEQIKAICKQNGQLMALAKDAAGTQKYNDVQLQKEADEIAAQDELRYLLWVDPERANAFLSKKVILVEGKTEKAFFSYLLNNPAGQFFSRKGISDISIIDINGKFHFYKFANLLNALGIPCWIMYDGDCDKIDTKYKISHQKLNEYVEQLKTNGIIVDCLRLDPELEQCLGFDKDEHNPDISMYHNLLKNQDNCSSKPDYINIVRFVDEILKKPL